METRNKNDEEKNIFLCETPFHLIQAICYANHIREESEIVIINNATLNFHKDNPYLGTFEYSRLVIYSRSDFLVRELINKSALKKPVKLFLDIMRYSLPNLIRIYRKSRSGKLRLFNFQKNKFDGKLWYLFANEIYLHEDGAVNYIVDENGRIRGYEPKIKNIILTQNPPDGVSGGILEKFVLFDLSQFLMDSEQKFTDDLIGLFVGQKQAVPSINRKNTIVFFTQVLDIMFLKSFDIQFRRNASFILTKFILKMKEKYGFNIFLKLHPNVLDARTLYEHGDVSVFDAEIPSFLPSELIRYLGKDRSPFLGYFSLYSTVILNSRKEDAVKRVNILDLDMIQNIRSLESKSEKLDEFGKMLDFFIESFVLG